MWSVLRRAMWCPNAPGSAHEREDALAGGIVLGEALDLG
jgi:hypothetical protein